MRGALPVPRSTRSCRHQSGNCELMNELVVLFSAVGGLVTALVTAWRVIVFTRGLSLREQERATREKQLVKRDEVQLLRDEVTRLSDRQKRSDEDIAALQDEN